MAQSGFVNARTKLKMTNRIDNVAAWLPSCESRETVRINMPHVPIYVRLTAEGLGFGAAPDPFDHRLSRAMSEVTRHLVSLSGAVCGFTWGGEVSLAFYNEDMTSRPFFDTNRYRLISILSSLATAKLIQQIPECLKRDLPSVSGRMYEVPSPSGLIDVLLWREQECEVTALRAIFRKSCPPPLLDDLNRLTRGEIRAMVDMLVRSGADLSQYPGAFRHGTVVRNGGIAAVLDMPLSSIQNRSGVIFRGERPVTSSAPLSAGGNAYASA